MKDVVGIVFLADSIQNTLYFTNDHVMMHFGSLAFSKVVEFQQMSCMWRKEGKTALWMTDIICQVASVRAYHKRISKNTKKEKKKA